MTNPLYYVGLDIHKKTVAWCIKRADGTLVGQGSAAATRQALAQWAEQIPGPWMGGMEATIFCRWIYEFLKPYARELQVAHPAKLVAISASKKKNDRNDARILADLLRADLFPEIQMVSRQIYDLRQQLRYRNTLVRNAVQAHNKTAGLLMEAGEEFDKKKLKGKKYFTGLLQGLEHAPESVKQLLKLSRSNYEVFQMTQKRLVAALKEHPAIKERVERLMTIGGVGEITALTWVLEVGDPERLGSIAKAISYCGLCSAQVESAGKSYRGPLSKKRNANLQTVLIEAAKLGPRHNEQLREVYDKHASSGNSNRATVMVARKLVAWMLAVDKSGKPFEVKGAAA